MFDVEGYIVDAGYEALANAIILQACKDYRSAIREFDIYEMKQIRHFFHSQWFNELTKLDADYILNEIEREEIYEKDRRRETILRKKIQRYDAKRVKGRDTLQNKSSKHSAI